MKGALVLNTTVLPLAHWTARRKFRSARFFYPAAAHAAAVSSIITTGRRIADRGATSKRRA